MVMAAGAVYRLVIASKYASLTDAEYHRYISCENEHAMNEMRVQLQLITGWSRVDLPFFAHEASLAVQRIGIKPDAPSKPCFRICRRSAENWVRLLGPYAKVLKTEVNCANDGHVIVDVSDFIAVVAAGSQPSSKVLSRVFQFCVLLIFLTALLPCFLRISCPALRRLEAAQLGDNAAVAACISSQFFGTGTGPQAFSVMLVYMMSMAALPLTFFFLAYAMSAMRHYNTCKLLGLLIRVDTVSKTETEAPVIDFKVPDNIRAWARARLALNYFGTRYRTRMDIYTRVAAMLLAFSLLWLYLNAFSGSESILLDVRFHYTLFFCVAWGGFFAVILALLAMSNLELERHELELLHHRLAVREGAAAERLAMAPVEASKKAKKKVRSNRKRRLHRAYRRVKDALTNESFEDPATKPGKATMEDVDGSEESFDGDEGAFDDDDDDNGDRGGCNDGGDDGGDGPEARLRALGQVQDQLEMQQAAAAAEAALEEQDDLLETAGGVCEAALRLDPMKFLGMVASWDLVSQYLTLWVFVMTLTLNIAGLTYSPT